METQFQSFKCDTVEFALSLISSYQREYNVTRYIINYDSFSERPYYVTIYFD